MVLLFPTHGNAAFDLLPEAKAVLEVKPVVSFETSFAQLFSRLV